MKLIGVHTAKKKLGKDRKGSIEGLPLYLMIIIMIATLGTAVIVGWMGDIETPATIDDIEVEPGYIDLSSASRSSDGYYIYKGDATFTILDNNGNPVKEANVVLSGLGVSLYNGKTAAGVTDDNGSVTFKNLRIHINGDMGNIKITASKSGYGESTCNLMVVH